MNDELMSFYEENAIIIQNSPDFQDFNKIMNEGMSFVVSQTMIQFQSKYSQLIETPDDDFRFRMVMIRCVGNGTLFYATMAKKFGVSLRKNHLDLNELILKLQNTNAREKYSVERAFTQISLGAMLSVLGEDERIIQIQYLARGAVATSFLISLIACEY